MSEPRQIASKWAKTAALLKDERIVPHIPETRRYSQEAFDSLLSKYGKVVLKPNVGTGGSGVVWIEKQGGRYLMKYGGTVRSYASISALMGRVGGLVKARTYLVQRGIRLAEIGGRPIDYRIKIVKENDRWTTRAIVGRLARKGLFVTNLCRGGTQLTSADAIHRSLPAVRVRDKKREMRNLAYRCKDSLLQRYPNADQLGFDFGLDQTGKIWIFEVNTRPH